MNRSERAHFLRLLDESVESTTYEGAMRCWAEARALLMHRGYTGREEAPMVGKHIGMVRLPVQGDGARRLARLALGRIMAQISEEQWCATWMNDLGFRLWRRVCTASGTQVEMLHGLAIQAGGWWADYDQFVPLHVWYRVYALGPGAMADMLLALHRAGASPTAPNALGEHWT